jgi:aldehyde:ferredoxin oxidoreductase
MRECKLCDSTENVDEHHTSYEPERTVFLCRSYHKTVHGAEDHPLHPDDEPDGSTIKLTEETKAVLDQENKDGETFSETVARLLGETSGTVWTEDEIREIAESVVREHARR